jgi:hypothetical protein
MSADESENKAKKARESVNQITESALQAKKDQILDAVKKGNRGKARRHAVEIRQLLGHGTNELPIEDQLEELE